MYTELGENEARDRICDYPAIPKNGINESRMKSTTQTNVVYICPMRAVVANIGSGALLEQEQTIKVFGNRNCLKCFPRRSEFYKAEFCLALKASRIFRAVLYRLKPFLYIKYVFLFVYVFHKSWS
jgi:hypothetical protein